MTSTRLYSDFLRAVRPLAASARAAAETVLGLRKGERVLIVANPTRDSTLIAMAIHDAALGLGAVPAIVYQAPKTLLDHADPCVLAALNTEPEVIVSISANKMGKDPEGLVHPRLVDGKPFRHVFDYLVDGVKKSRAFWSPGITRSMFARTVSIDYARLKAECAALKSVLDRAVRVRVTSPGGTDLVIPVSGRLAFVDDGDFRAPGAGGNLPAGETFISPQNACAEGVIVFDGSITLESGDIPIRPSAPIHAEVKGGFVTRITGGKEAELLERTLANGAERAIAMEKEGKLAAGEGEVFAKNSRHLGELGIGLNPKARITGNMLEDEKARGTCHIAIGKNYDEDAPTLIHQDGVIRNPDIAAVLQDGTEILLMRRGSLLLPTPTPAPTPTPTPSSAS